MLVFISEFLNHFDRFLVFCLFVFVFTFHFSFLSTWLGVRDHGA